MSGRSDILLDNDPTLIPIITILVSRLITAFVKMTLLLLITFWLSIGMFQWWDQSVYPVLREAPSNPLASKKTIHRKPSEKLYIPGPSVSRLLNVTSMGTQQQCRQADIYEKLKRSQYLISSKSAETTAILPMPINPMPESNLYNPTPTRSNHAGTASYSNMGQQKNCEGPDMAAIYEKFKRRQYVMNTNPNEMTAILAMSTLAGTASYRNVQPQINAINSHTSGIRKISVVTTGTSSQINVDSQPNYQGQNTPENSQERQRIIDAKMKEINALLLPVPTAVKIPSTFTRTQKKTLIVNDLRPSGSSNKEDQGSADAIEKTPTTSANGPQEKATTSAAALGEPSTTLASGPQEKATTSAAALGEPSTTSASGPQEKATTSAAALGEPSTTLASGPQEKATTSAAALRELPATSASGAEEKSTTFENSNPTRRQKCCNCRNPKCKNRKAETKSS